MNEHHTVSRLFVAEDLTAGREVILTDGQVHYLRNVMRRSVGDVLLLFNARDGEWTARITRLDKRHGVAAVNALVRPQAAEDGPVLLFAPLKKTATDFLVEKATELGVGGLWPVLTERSQTRRINDERLRAIAIEAAEQCERLTVPELRPLEPLQRALSGWPPACPLLLADETGGGAPLAGVLTGMESTPGFLVGPEGGFTKTELDLIGNKAFVTRINLGPRILRAETAALAVLSCWQALAGDGADAPRPRTDGVRILE